jgi:hypothetical protein
MNFYLCLHLNFLNFSMNLLSPKFLANFCCNSSDLLPPFGASVLEPGFDLRVGHLEGFGQGGPLCGGQVLLFVKALLQLGDLQSGERGARLLSLGRRAVLVRVANPPCDRERGCNTNKTTLL